MSDFTILITPASGVNKAGTDVEKVGKLLDQLATIHLTRAPGQPQFHRTSEMAMFNDQKGQWDGPARDAANALIEALSYNLHDGNNVTTIQHLDTPQPHDVHNDLKLVFVYEDEGHMVIPVPNKKQIDRGLADAPLRPALIYSRLNAAETVTALRKTLEDHQMTVGGMNPEDRTDEENDLLDLTQAELDTMEKWFRFAADLRAAEVDKDDAFYQQLGDYSVRQCGH